MTAKLNSLEKIRIDFEYTEDIVDFKALIARINLKKRARAVK